MQDIFAKVNIAMIEIPLYHLRLGNQVEFVGECFIIAFFIYNHCFITENFSWIKFRSERITIIFLSCVTSEFLLDDVYKFDRTKNCEK
jgi:hypothetical protein